MNKEERLREYINKDYSYINYKTGVEEGSDFDKFCIQHCKDIEELLEENQKLKADLQLHRGALKREHEAIHRANDLEEVIDRIEKYIEKETRIYGLSMSKGLGIHFDNILGILKGGSNE